MRKLLQLSVLGVLALASALAKAQSPTPIGPLVPESGGSAAQQAILRPGQVVALRVRQVIPRDGTSAADRVLSGRAAILAGDRVLAEVLAPGSHPPALIGGTVAAITPPGRFGKAGRVTLELGQLVARAPDRPGLVPWIFDLEDRRFGVRMRQKILLALFAAEGAGLGANLGAQLEGGGNPTFIGGGAAIGLISGIGYASFMPGHEAALEPGDTFRIEVGTTSYRPLPTTPTPPLYPADDPARKRGDRSR